VCIHRMQYTPPSVREVPVAVGGGTWPLNLGAVAWVWAHKPETSHCTAVAAGYKATFMHAARELHASMTWRSSFSSVGLASEVRVVLYGSERCRDGISSVKHLCGKAGDVVRPGKYQVHTLPWYITAASMLAAAH
jgi:hypothetical protein